jgi:hypothetical protein
MKLTNQLPCCTLLSIFLPLLQLVDDLIKLAVAADSPPLVPHAAWSIRPGLASVGYNQLLEGLLLVYVVKGSWSLL